MEDDRVAKVARFVEKPDMIDAENMLQSGNFLWNSGIFMFRAEDMISAFATFAPDTLKLTKKAIDAAYNDLGFLRLSERYWNLLEDISVDYAIMEKAQNLVAVRYEEKWSDLGGWDAVWKESKDDFGNAFHGGAHSLGCSNSFLRSENSNQQIVGVGLNNIVAIAMPDAVLVANKSNAQDVKAVVNLLKNKIFHKLNTLQKITGLGVGSKV